METRFSIPKTAVPPAADLGVAFSGSNPAGDSIRVSDRGILRRGVPVLPVCGELHYARVPAEDWEYAICQMKACGVDVISSYCFWILHEPIEGELSFAGSLHLRKFLMLCRKHHMGVILRIGPFVHGEIRNGGLPDWLYGKPFSVREDNPGYLHAVRRWYGALAAQTEGLWFAQGGPVLGIQVENEYGHSSAPWECAPASGEWIPCGRGSDHLRTLLQIARDAGFQPALVTATAWGGAEVPLEEMLPVWGGYAYQPWLFYPYVQDPPERHPATEEYRYCDARHPDGLRCASYDPGYPPESRPYLCTELMAGMTVAHRYRFVLPGNSVDALANVRLGSGCAMLGYYMFRGGINPLGPHGEDFRERELPRRSYDFQAPIGAYGQLRPAWYRLRLLHLFLRQFGGFLTGADTVLPQTAAADPAPLSCAIRTADGSGFLFCNNFQDHKVLPARQQDTVLLQFPHSTLSLTDLSLASGENTILPFQLPMDGLTLRWASAQPVTRVETANGPLWVFFSPAGMLPAYHFAGEGVQGWDGCPAEFQGEDLVFRPNPDETNVFSLAGPCGPISVLTLTREDSLHFSLLEIGGQAVPCLSSEAWIPEGEGTFSFESTSSTGWAACYPEMPPLRLSAGWERTGPCRVGPFQGFSYRCTDARPEISLAPEPCGPGRWILRFPEAAQICANRWLLTVSYYGDAGQLFQNGILLADDFCNGTPWEVRLDGTDCRTDLVLLLTEYRREIRVDPDSPMAEWTAQYGDTQKLFFAVLRPLYTGTVQEETA